MNERVWGSAIGVAIGVGVLAAACGQTPIPTAREGRALYAENGCASCHGDKGYGDGPVAATMTTRPRDFRDVAAFKNGFDVGPIAATIARGIFVDAAPATGATGAPVNHHQGMPPFAHLSEVERQSLALYVISLRSQSR